MPTKATESTGIPEHRLGSILPHRPSAFTGYQLPAPGGPMTFVPSHPPFLLELPLSPS